MSFLCKLGIHQPMPSRLWNDGHYFSSCTRCNTALIRTPEESWHPVPPGMRVVWRPRTGEDVVWPHHIL